MVNEMSLASVAFLVCLLGQLPAAEEKFAAEVAKADAESAKIKHAAAETRLKAYREALTAATKAGDFDKAMMLKARIEELEQEPEAAPLKRPRPKDVVRFQGHTYALVKDAVTWHVAKQRCEEMGGHLVCMETPAEIQFVTNLCSTSSLFTWAGASDEESEGEWKWVNGKPVVDPRWITFDQQQENHYLGYCLEVKKWFDCTSTHRSFYVCEWDR